MKKILLTLLFSLLVLNLKGCKTKTVAPERSYPVAIGDVMQKDTPIYVEAIGNVYSLQNVLIRPQVAGIIQEAYVKQGQYVKKGDPLYKIDPRPYQAALDQAKATLAKDEATLKYSEIQVERTRALLQKDFLSKLNFEQFESQVEFNKGQVESV